MSSESMSDGNRVALFVFDAKWRESVMEVLRCGVVQRLGFEWKMAGEEQIIAAIHSSFFDWVKFSETFSEHADIRMKTGIPEDDKRILTPLAMDSRLIRFGHKVASDFIDDVKNGRLGP